MVRKWVMIFSLGISLSVVCFSAETTSVEENAVLQNAEQKIDNSIKGKVTKIWNKGVKSIKINKAKKNANERLEKLKTTDPELYDKFIKAKESWKNLSPEEKKTAREKWFEQNPGAKEKIEGLKEKKEANKQKRKDALNTAKPENWESMTKEEKKVWMQNYKTEKKAERQEKIAEKKAKWSEKKAKWNEKKAEKKAKWVEKKAKWVEKKAEKAAE